MSRLHVDVTHTALTTLRGRTLRDRADDDSRRCIADRGLVDGPRLQGLPLIPACGPDEDVPGGLVVVDAGRKVHEIARDGVDPQGVEGAGGGGCTVSPLIGDPLRRPENLSYIGEGERRLG